MFYYPELLKNQNLINIQVIFPGGWNLDIESNKGHHFLLEHLLFSPTKKVEDPDEWLWENTLDFWTITSFESIRLNFTLSADQVENFIPFLETLLKPREIDREFAVKEIKSLQNFWTTERDKKEDQVLRELFKNENVVHPNPDLIDQLNIDDVDLVENIWKAKKPYLIVCGEMLSDEVLACAQVCDNHPKFEVKTDYSPPKTFKEFNHPERWGVKIELQGSHVYELLLIELWDRVFKSKFFFEYHQDQMYIWTDPIEYPHLLAKKVKNYVVTKEDFAKAKHAYLRFLEEIYFPKNHKHMEKMSELVEGLHGHEYQSPTYKIDPKRVDLRTMISEIRFDEFKSFYQSFIQN